MTGTIEIVTDNLKRGSWMKTKEHGPFYLFDCSKEIVMFSYKFHFFGAHDMEELIGILYHYHIIDCYSYFVCGHSWVLIGMLL